MAAAGSVSVESTYLGGDLTKYTIRWTSSSGGAVAENAVAVARGHVHQVKFVPDGGDTQPPVSHSFKLCDDDGLDLLCGYGVNRGTADPGIVRFGDGEGIAPSTFFEGGDVFPTVANAGDANAGTVVLIMGR